MAHQCLKCGATYPDGSPQILKGCEGCKGTRFFYTEQPLAEKERSELAEQTELDLEKLALGKGGRDALTPRRLPTKDELPLGSGQDRDWVAGGPNYLRGVVEDVVRRANERKPVFRVGAPGSSSSKPLAEWVREQGGRVDDGSPAPAPSQASSDPSEDLLDSLFTEEQEAAWRSRGAAAATAASPAETPEPTGSTSVSDEDLVYKRAPRAIPKPVSLAGVAVDAAEDEALREAAARARERVAEEPTPRPVPNAASGVEESLYPEGQAPETVAVKDSGVYELDVKRLLEKNPLVIHRDGTYSLHLPSLMETLERKKQR